MHSYKYSNATCTPAILLQADQVWRRITASDSVAALVAGLAYGEPGRDHGALLAAVTLDRTAATGAMRL